MATGKPFLMGATVREQIEEVIMKVGKYSCLLYYSSSSFILVIM